MSNLKAHLRTVNEVLIRNKVLTVLQSQRSTTAEAISYKLAEEDYVVEGAEVVTVLLRMKEGGAVRVTGVPDVFKGEPEEPYVTEWGLPGASERKPVRVKVTNLEGVYLVKDMIDGMGFSDDVDIEDGEMYVVQDAITLEDLLPRVADAEDDLLSGLVPRRWNVHIVIEMWEEENEEGNR